MINKAVQELVHAIGMIPRQFFNNTTTDICSDTAYEQFVSQLIVRYRKITGNYCKTELVLPSSESIRKFADYEDNKMMVRKLTASLSSSANNNPSLFIELAGGSSASQVAIMEIRADEKLKRGAFYWDFFKLNYHVDNHRCICGAYFIINQDVDSIQNKIAAYYDKSFYSSLRAENIYFLIKKNYASDVVILDYKGKSIL